MKIEVCDLCECRVDKYNSTRVTIKDYKALLYTEYGSKAVPRKWKGVICDNCLNQIVNNSRSKK